MLLLHNNSNCREAIQFFCLDYVTLNKYRVPGLTHHHGVNSGIFNINLLWEINFWQQIKILHAISLGLIVQLLQLNGPHATIGKHTQKCPKSSQLKVSFSSIFGIINFKGMLWLHFINLIFNWENIYEFNFSIFYNTHIF